ncbi:MAG: phosphoribosylaminoimidazolecarboxamide formyltransferase [Azospirillum sp.]|nr:phosphoribosylaminoimidazolecarboxamide formyltransferase [Azospirillum sp.]
MDEGKFSSTLGDLESRLSDAQKREDVRKGTNQFYSMPTGALAIAFRIGVEMVSALLVGVGLGLLIDHVLGSAPLGMIIMFFFGAAAALRNVYRTVGSLGGSSTAAPKE